MTQNINIVQKDTGQERRKRRRAASIVVAGTINDFTGRWTIQKPEFIGGCLRHIGTRTPRRTVVQPLSGDGSNACNSTRRRGVFPGLSRGMERGDFEKRHDFGSASGSRGFELSTGPLGRLLGHGALHQHEQRWNSRGKSQVAAMQM